MNTTISTQELTELLGVTRAALKNYPDARSEYGRHDLAKFMRLLLAKHSEEVSELKAAARKVESDLRTREKSVSDKEAYFQGVEDQHKAAMETAKESIRELRTKLLQSEYDLRNSKEEILSLQAKLQVESKNNDFLSVKFGKLYAAQEETEKQKAATFDAACEEREQSEANPPLTVMPGVDGEGLALAPSGSVPLLSDDAQTDQAAAQALALALAQKRKEQAEACFKMQYQEHQARIAKKTSWLNSWKY